LPRLPLTFLLGNFDVIVAIDDRMRKALIIVAILTMLCILLVSCVYLSWSSTVAIGLVVLGGLGYVERILNLKLSRTWGVVLLVLFVMLSAGNYTYTLLKERSLNQRLKSAESTAASTGRQIGAFESKQLDLTEKLTQAEDDAAKAKKQIADLSEYGDIATYNFSGYQQSGQFLSPFTPVAKWDEGYLTIRDGVYYFSCGPDSMTHYENVIKKSPIFPFAYFAVSACLLKKKDPSWKKYAAMAQSILQKATKIPLHCQAHDGWLEQANKILDPAQLSSVFVLDKRVADGSALNSGQR
jgi:hypothetical protein